MKIKTISKICNNNDFKCTISKEKTDYFFTFETWTNYGQIGYTFMIDDNNSIKGFLSYDYELRTITFYNDKGNKEFTINI